MRLSGILLAVAFIVSGTGLSGGAWADPHNDYMLKCMGCHGPDGAEVKGKVPALKDHVARFLAVPGGRDYLVQVPGARQTPLDDEALAALLNWLVVHFDGEHMPPDFMPYTKAEVQALRATKPADIIAERRRLIDAMAEGETTPPY
jgi:hypothetical protein